METRLLKKQMTAAYQYSYTRLALNYYTLFETMIEDTDASVTMTEYCRIFNELLKAYFGKKDVLHQIDELRKKTTHEVEILTSYTDCFQIYEYVLNRLERRFKTLPESEYDDESFTELLSKFIMNAKESTAVNSRIKQVISQLPVRFTKQKFFALVTKGLSVYLDSPKENLKDILYVLETESMATLPEHFADDRKELYEILEQLRHTDYRNMTEGIYEQTVKNLNYGTSILTDESQYFIALQEMINDLYVIILSDQDAIIDVKEEHLYRSLIQQVLDKVEEGADSLEDDSIETLLIQMEGRQETYFERYLSCALPEETDELKQDSNYLRAVNVDRLLSGSTFAQLQTLKTNQDIEENQDLSELTDKSYLDQMTQRYFEELEKVFAVSSKPIIRAIMAKVLSDLPVYFNSGDEVKAYIKGSLESCIDEAEKETCKELLEELINYENELV